MTGGRNDSGSLGITVLWLVISIVLDRKRKQAKNSPVKLIENYLKLTSMLTTSAWVPTLMYGP